MNLLSGLIAKVKQIKIKVHSPKWCIIFFIGSGPNSSKYIFNEIAAKDVPTGYKYKKVDDSDVPTDRSFRNAWIVDESDLTDGVGA